MLKFLRTINPLRYEFLVYIEAGFIGLFLIQALRFLVGMSYSRMAGVLAVAALPAGTVDVTASEAINPAVVSQEIGLFGLVLALPLLTLIFGRIRFAFVVAVLGIIAGRAIMLNNDAALTPLMGAQIAAGFGLIYVGLLIRNRASVVPYFFILGLGLDQLFRAIGNTFDPSWSAQSMIQIPISAQTVISIPYTTLHIIISAVAGIAALLNAISDRSKSTTQTLAPGDIDRGILPLWNAIGLGAMLYLQLSLLALPNAIAGRADTDYTAFVPLVLAATLLPLVPAVRRQARNLLIPFDANTRGWIWLILLVLTLVIGTRLPRLAFGNFELPVGGIALVITQFLASLVWWWFAPPQAERKRNFTGLWLVLTALIFALLVIGDIFTYEYAFVRNFAAPFDVLNSIVPPLLRGFRGMGIGLLIVAAFLMVLPMLQTNNRIPWTGGSTVRSFLMLLIVAGAAGAASALARPPIVQPVINVPEIRVGTYNIHGGYSEFFHYNLEAIAQTIERSGAEVVLLQEVETGRMTSFGVDQSLWLARRLKMDRRFYATNEGLQGLAVLSRVPIVFDDGVLLPSIDTQTGLQRVQIRPDESAVTIYNTSLGLLLQGNSIEEQESNQTQQLNVILETIELHIQQDYGGQLGRALLGGTFHNVPDSPLLQSLTRTGFSDPFAGSNPDLSYTLVRSDRKARIDYLWLWSPGLSSTGNGVISSDASDHRLAFVGVQIRRG